MKYICTICGFAHEGDTPPEFCPQCSAPEFKFKVQDQQGKTLADEHHVGIIEGVDADIVSALRQEFQGNSAEIGVYVAMARQADREGYPEIADTFRRIAWEEAEQVGKFAEMLGEMLTADTRSNIIQRLEAEFVACESKKKLATLAKQLNLDAIHDSVHEMCKDEARHNRMLVGLRNRFFE